MTVYENNKIKKSGIKPANNVLELIFNTPIVRLNRIVEPDMANVYAKLEFFTPGGSLKDRIALAMIEDAEKKELINSQTVIVEATTANTGISTALVCAVKGYKCILVMPKSMNIEIKKIFEIFGAEVVLTSEEEGIQGAVKKAEEISKNTKNSFMLQQFKNSTNPEIHRETTAQEILSSMSGEIDAFVAGIGTGGTITGVGEILKRKNNNIKIIAVEPENSAVLSGKEPGTHKIQGIGAGFIPEVLNRSIIDEIITVSDEDAYQTAKKLAILEGVFCGPSSAAACFAALKIAKELSKGKKVVTIFPDKAERYISML